MMHRLRTFSLAVVVSLTTFAGPVRAEIAGQAKCSSPSWSVLMAGECLPNGAVVFQAPPDAVRAEPTELLDFPTGPLVPEPETYVLMLVGLVAMALVPRRRHP